MAVKENPLYTDTNRKNIFRQPSWPGIEKPAVKEEPLQGPSTLENQNARMNVAQQPVPEFKGGGFTTSTATAPTEELQPQGMKVGYSAESLQRQPIFRQPTAPTAQSAKINPQINRSIQQNINPAPTYQTFRDAMFGSEAEREKASSRKAKVMAVGDALRHIGNLATTIGGATPQKYATSPALEERESYKAERGQRDTMGYQQLSQWQKQKQIDLENDRANAALEIKRAEAEYKRQSDAYKQQMDELKLRSQLAKDEDSRNKAELERQLLQKKIDTFQADFDAKMRVYDSRVAANNRRGLGGGGGGGRRGSSSGSSSSSSSSGDSGSSRMQTYYGWVGRKKAMSTQDTVSMYKYFVKKGYIKPEASGFMDEGKMSAADMYERIVDAAQDDNNPYKGQISRELVDNFGFAYEDNETAMRRRATADRNMAADKKKKENKKKRDTIISV